MRTFCGRVLAAALCVACAAEGSDNACDKWNIFTDFGLFEGALRKTENGFAADENGIRVETAEKTSAAGVTHRSTVVRNMSKKHIAATCLLDVFHFEGGDFEVYTQANTWMNESRGAWQPLHTCVGARAGGISVSIRYLDFKNRSHQCRLEQPTDSTDECARHTEPRLCLRSGTGRRGEDASSTSCQTQRGKCGPPSCRGARTSRP